MLTYKHILFNFAFVFIIKCHLVSADDIPAMMWNIKGNAIHIKPVSALGHNDKIFADSLKDIHHQEASILVFAVNKLSLEDFSNDKPSTMNNTLNNIEVFLDRQPHVLLPSVKDPLNYIHKAHCGVQEIVVDNKIDESILHSVSSALQRSCVVILHISDDGIISNEGEIKSVFLPSIENSNKNIVGVFTGVKSSWGAPNDRHIFRNLLQASASDDNFLNYTGCIIMYADSIKLIPKGEVNNTVTLPFPPSLEGSSCENSSRVLQMTFSNLQTGFSSVVIRFEFPESRGSWKTEGTLTLISSTGRQELELDTDTIQAPMKFSFSCGDLRIKSKNSTYDARLRFNRFQIQPYQVKDVFNESFDCVTFFTIPIWMGIVVSILFIVIINIGVYALFSVRTMDRFDDPKGKTISIAPTAD